MAARLKERYEQEVRPKLIERFGYKSSMQTPRLEKITLNMGVGEAKVNTAMLDAATEQLAVIAGQRPAVRRARKSIANFKLRAGMPVGVKVTLRGERMYEMLDRLQSIAIPRVRDFRGLSPRSFDGRGNYSLGIKEQIIFPEIDYDSIDQVRGLDVTITTTAGSDEEAFELLRLLGMPFRSEDGAGRPAAEAPDEAADEPAEEAAAELAEEAADEPADEAADEPAEQTVAETPAEQAAEEPAEQAPGPAPQAAEATAADETEAAPAAEPAAGEQPTERP
jgi:large subunit ribosomal protein L5